MSKAVTSQEFYGKIKECLALPPNVIDLKIQLGVETPIVKVTVTFYPDIKQCEDLVAEIKNYKLVEMTGDVPEPPA